MEFNDEDIEKFNFAFTREVARLDMKYVAINCVNDWHMVMKTILERGLQFEKIGSTWIVTKKGSGRGEAEGNDCFALARAALNCMRNSK